MRPIELTPIKRLLMSQHQRLTMKLLLIFTTVFILCFAASAQQENEKSAPITQEPEKKAEDANSTEPQASSEQPSEKPTETVVDKTAEQTQAPIEKPLVIAEPISFLQQQQEDIKHYLEPDIIKPMLVGMKEHVTLVEVNKTGIAKGVMILLPDWQQNATGSNALNFLRLELPQQGWTTITIQPPAKPENYPSHANERDKRIEENQKALTDYQDDLGLLLKQIDEKAKEYPGVIVVISEGSNGAVLTNIYQKQLVAMPTALILLSSFLPTTEDNKTVASSITQLSIPVLDLTLYRDNRYVNPAAQLRSDAVKQEMKPYYRQKQLHNITPSYYPNDLLIKEINGWLASIGW